MKRLFARPFLTAFCSTLLCIGSSMIFANSQENFFSEMRQGKQAKDLAHHFAERSPLTEMGHFNDGYYLQRIHTDSYYHLVAYSDNGDVVQLHDASKWEIEWKVCEKVLRWEPRDDIFIKPCASWFSRYKYVLYNHTKNQAVEANLINPPLPMGAYTFRIVNIQPYERLVLLSDNTVWQVNSDAYFPYWQVGQRVMVGVNNKWRTAPFPHILLNVDLSGEPYSEAAFYGYSAGG